MFVGHYSAAIVAKAASPQTPFWLLVLAAQLVDVFWSVFIYFGVEKVTINPDLLSNPLELTFMPYTHSLLATSLWMLAVFVLLRLASGRRLSIKQCAVVALVVGSHWLLDLIVHRPDLHIVEGLKAGFGLWDYPLLAFSIEIALIAGAILYLYQSRDLNAKFKKRIMLFGVVLFFIQVSSNYGVIPHSVPMLAITAGVSFLALSFVGFLMERRLNS